MQIRRIKSVSGYKSFADFKWEKFCKDKGGNESIFQNFTVIFGENGSGKSSICDILKSISQTQDFTNSHPTLVEIEIKNDSGSQDYKYENGEWTPVQLDKKTFLFFDLDFVNANVHTHGVRSNNLQQGAHTQKAGKLIIDLDEQANNLKDAIEEKRKEIEFFQKSKSGLLGKIFSSKDREFYNIYSSTDEAGKNLKIAEVKNELKELEVGLATLHKLDKQYSEIGQIPTLNEILTPDLISSAETYIELSTRQIKEKAQGEADDKIKSHFQQHRTFIETAKDRIPQDYSKTDCPLCMQPLSNAIKVIEYYRAAFDQTYEIEKRKLLADVEDRKNELNKFKLSLGLLPTKVTDIFDSLERTKTTFEIPNIYSLDEKGAYVAKANNFPIPALEELLGVLESLKRIDHEQIDVTKVYETASKEIASVKDFLVDLNKLVVSKNKIIDTFKAKYSDQGKISSEIREKFQKKVEAEAILSFLQSEKLDDIKSHDASIEEQRVMSDNFKKRQDELKNYLEQTIPDSVITQMITMLERFNLNFTIEHIKPSANTKDYSFAFMIKDRKGKEREFKNGLSEGERQLISLAFFFAINENLPNKDKSVLIFDDPITSLDSPNLKILAELIHKKVQEFSQVIVFTHHPLFFKYLAKCENPNPARFGVLKNADVFGGSFIFSDPGFEISTEVQKCNEEISESAQSGSLKPEEIALKYGQLLRLAVEKFIKNDLLMWNKDGDFGKEIVVNLGRSKSKIQKLDDADLEVIINMYKYCNYSNLLHADKETPSALSELRTHIDKFTGILDKTKN